MSFEVCSNRTLSEKYCEKRAEAVKRVLMCAEASMPLHYHTNNLTPPLHSDFPEYLHKIRHHRVFYTATFNKPRNLFSHLHLVIRANKFNTGTKQKVCVSKSIQFSENDHLHHVGSVESTEFWSLLFTQSLVRVIKHSLYRNGCFLICQLSVVAVASNPNEDFKSWGGYAIYNIKY